MRGVVTWRILQCSQTLTAEANNMVASNGKSSGVGTTPEQLARKVTIDPAAMMVMKRQWKRMT